MSCLKKVIDTVETECGKSFTNVVLWSDGMGTQFRSRFIFQLLAGTMFLNKSLCWFYNEGHHGKVPMDDVGGTIKNVIFRKVKSGQIVVHTPKEFSDAAMKFVPSIVTVYLPKSDEIVEPECINQAQPIPETLPIHKMQCRIFQDGSRPESFTLSGTKKLVTLLVVTRSPIKAIENVQRVGMVYRRRE